MYVTNTEHNNIDPCVYACFDRVAIQTLETLLQLVASKLHVVLHYYIVWSLLLYN